MVRCFARVAAACLPPLPRLQRRRPNSSTSSSSAFSRMMSGCSTSHVEDGADINFEMLFTPPDFFQRHRVAAAASRRLAQYRGQHQCRLFRSDLGDHADPEPVRLGRQRLRQRQPRRRPAGRLSPTTPRPDRKKLGSTALFRESVELGYQLTPTVSVSGFVDHMSNADLAPHNAGITDAGARLGFKF